MNKNVRQVPVVLLTACLATAAVAQEADGPLHYLESDGVVVLEPETAELPAGWTLATDLPDYLGDGYIVWEGANYYRKQDAGVGAMTFHFTITNPGNYQLLWRNRIARGESDKEHNDSWARMSTGTDVLEETPLNGWTKAYMNELDVWSWATKTVDGEGFPLRQYFAAGDHTLDISGRSTGHAIDRIVLLSYETRGNRPETLDGLAVSDTSGGSGIDGGGENGGTDTAPEETYASVNALEVSVDDMIAADTIGVCADDRLALAPTTDAHERGSSLSDTNRLLLEGDDRALLKFDLRAVPPAAAAHLRYSTLDTLEAGLLFALASHSDWPEIDNHPDPLVELGSAEAQWEEDLRYESELDGSLLQSQIETLSIALTAGSDSLSIAASEQSERSPLLILQGESGFCDSRGELLVALAAEEAAEAEAQAQEEAEEAAPSSVDEPMTDKLEEEVPSMGKDVSGVDTGIPTAQTPTGAPTTPPVVTDAGSAQEPDTQTGSLSPGWLLIGLFVRAGRRVRPGRRRAPVAA